jgi:hypothetical protein
MPGERASNPDIGQAQQAKGFRSCAGSLGNSLTSSAEAIAGFNNPISRLKQLRVLTREPKQLHRDENHGTTPFQCSLLKEEVPFRFS